MGKVNNVLADKTGVLTLNRMKVVELWLENKFSKQLSLENYSKNTVRLLGETIAYSTTAKLFPDREGSHSDCALLEFARNFGYEYTAYRPSEKIIRVTRELEINSIRLFPSPPEQKNRSLL
jgi:magnesium-transporting ATPase (P-type)